MRDERQVDVETKNWRALAGLRGEGISYIFAGKTEKTGGHGAMEWAVTWYGGDPALHSYCNTIPTPEGGTHEAGLRIALTKGLKGEGQPLPDRPGDAFISAGDAVGFRIMAEAGVMFLLFNLGLHFSLGRIRAEAGNIFGFGSLQMLVAGGGFAALFWALGLPPAFAVIAGKRGATTEAHGKKSFFYSTGLAEGTETIAVFIAMCLWPAWFGVIAYAYAGLCAATVIQRSAMAMSAFRD